YDYGGWTGKRLATYLAQRTGIELSSSSVRRILRQKNMLISKKIKYRIKAKHNINRN
ncbi:MAG: IS630 family transposase, partial [Cyanobacteria bacterium SW_5_48_44]